MLIIAPTAVLKIQLFAHSNQNDEEDRDARGERVVSADLLDALKHDIEGEDAHNDLFVLKEEGDWNKSEDAESSRFDFVCWKSHRLV